MGALTQEAVGLVVVRVGKHVLQAVAEGGGGSHDVALHIGGNRVKGQRGWARKPLK